MLALEHRAAAGMADEPAMPIRGKATEFVTALRQPRAQACF
ncbi:hypothetical protein B0G71_5694 [Paraburkholderia sp. BL27I4N3]|nr:hypothetical protein B0G71_5694 [Paraburkholderia sp. BL27I4N3]